MMPSKNAEQQKNETMSLGELKEMIIAAMMDRIEEGDVAAPIEVETPEPLEESRIAISDLVEIIKEEYQKVKESK